ncbi:amidohydrolase [Corallincola spongiicola]|uniref:Amidohydrolase n=1 Tax=Corallincola spongiicola TaxID=2520508 RepID=A0ABY1WMR5_9GAMM|nr:amidohydrolase [Corallincola spongiicola]
MKTSTILATALLASAMTVDATQIEPTAVAKLNSASEAQVIEWRRHLHQHPELSNREFETSVYIAKQMKALGLTVETGIAHTGVVAVLEGSLPGPTIALRADMDALPVTEQVDLPFASKATSEFRGQKVGVMHACGHDTHVAMLMGTAKNLVALKSQLPGKVVFIFQPAEEGAPEGEEGGAALMLKQGLFEKHQPVAVFGQHVTSTLPAGVIGYRSGPAMASADRFKITVHGKQTHGSRPWGGVDPIVVSSQIVMAVQTIASRQVDVTKAPSVISFGVIDGGIRNNIIPDSVELIGTIRNFDMGIREQIHEKLEHTAKLVAESAGAKAEVTIFKGYPVTVNNKSLTDFVVERFNTVAGKDNVREMGLITGAEDFSYYAQEVPGFFYFLGVTPAEQNPLTAPSNHSPRFYVDESALTVGTQTMTQLAVDYLQQHH